MTYKPCENPSDAITISLEKEDFLVFGAPVIEQDEIDEVVACLRSGWLGTGPRVTRFEESFRDYKGVKHALAVNSCTAALHLSLLAIDLVPGDEVITTPLTFCATINAIIHAGAIPVLADVDPATMNIDPVEVERRITQRTRAIVPVHFAGRPCDMTALRQVATKNDLLIIEDCAHAIETEYRGEKTGTLGDLGCFSFYVTKNVSTGEGGMVITDNEEWANRIKMLALHGLSRDAWKRYSDEGYKHYYVGEAGFKYNMMDIQAALGIHQLARVDKNWQKRRSLWDFYQQELADLPVTLPAEPDADTKHAHHLFTILIDEARADISRDGFLQAMNEKGIGTGVHYLSVPEHPYYQQRFGWLPEIYPNAMRIGRQTVSLPFSAKLNEQDAARVVTAIRYLLGAERGRATIRMAA